MAHDVGAWLALAVLALRPDRFERVALLDSALTGLTDDAFFSLREGSPAWHFHFHAHPEAAQRPVGNRVRAYFDWFMRAKSGRADSFSPAEIDRYSRIYEAPEVLAAGFAYYQSLPESAREVRRLLALPRSSEPPLLVLGGERTRGEQMLDEVRRMFPRAIGGAVPGVGHYLLEEAPEWLAARLREFSHGAR